MNIKNFIKKLIKKDTSKVRFLVEIIDNNIIDNISKTRWFTFESICKYLKNNELNIERITIKLLKE